MNRIKCIAHISHYADHSKFQELFNQFERETPQCPWNRDAAEGLALPPERRTGLYQSYIDGRERHNNNSSN